MLISKTAYYYKPKKPAGAEIKVYLQVLAEKHKRWGFDKMMLKVKMNPGSGVDNRLPQWFIPYGAFESNSCIFG